MDSMREHELQVRQDPQDRPPVGGDARRTPKLFRVLVLGGLALAVAFASVPRGATGAPEDSPTDGGGSPGW